jgi:hypothetical protein
MKQIIIDKITRDEVRKQFGIDNPLMSRILKYQNTGILSRKVRAHIFNFRDFHIVNN